MGFSNSVERKARKEHHCSWCSEKIEKSERYVYMSGCGDDGFWQTKLHIECHEALSKIPQGTDWDDWDDIWGNAIRGQFIVDDLENIDIEKLWEKLKKSTFHETYYSIFRGAHLQNCFYVTHEIADKLINIWKELELITLEYNVGFGFYKVIDDAA